MGSRVGGGAWLAFRAGMAVVLTVVFYLFSLGLAGLLLTIAYLSFGGRGRGGPAIQILIGCLVGACAILWGIFPRRQRFEAPGPLLDERSQPRLFSELKDIARTVGQEMPAEVYLVPDVNAGVLERGGVLGFGGRRVMLLGLPLMTVLSLPEFRGVLAHEFGHYAGGETRLGPWIHRTKEAILRTIGSLSSAGSVVRFLFIGYGKAFLRVTQAVSRRQEILADRLAMDVAGAPAAASGLRRVLGVAPAFHAYMGQEVLPILSSGFRPPLAEGFARFLGTRQMKASLHGYVEEMTASDAGDPYDSHPPLRVRLEALGNPAPLAPGEQGPPVTSLLEDREGLERNLFRFLFPGRPDLPSLPWREAGERIYLPCWRRSVEENGLVLRGLTPRNLPEAMSRPLQGDPRWRRLGAQRPVASNPRKVAILGATSLLLRMVTRGWKLTCEPGKDVALHRGDETFFPFQEAADLADGTTSAAGWIERCRFLGIADEPLDAPLPRSTAAP